MRYLICFTILLFLAAPGLMAQSQEEIDDALEFYPLEIGNYWQYRLIINDSADNITGTFFYTIEVIGDTTMIYDKSYRILEVNSNLQGKLPHHAKSKHAQQTNSDDLYYEYERLDEQTAEVFRWSPDSELEIYEILVDSLAARQGDYSTSARFLNIINYNYGTYHYGSHNNEYFGEVREVKLISPLGPPYITYTLIKGIGLNSYGYSGVSSSLLYAQINGEEFGDFVEVNVPGEPDLPRKATLHANYPNPFNPSTMISFDLAEAAAVQLDVYDLTGRKIQSLLNEQKPAGTHTVQFQAGNLSSGVYIYRLQVGDVAQSRKMVLVK